MPLQVYAETWLRIKHYKAIANVAIAGATVSAYLLYDHEYPISYFGMVKQSNKEWDL